MTKREERVPLQKVVILYTIILNTKLNFRDFQRKFLNAHIAITRMLVSVTTYEVIFGQKGRRVNKDCCQRGKAELGY